MRAANKNLFLHQGNNTDNIMKTALVCAVVLLLALLIACTRRSGGIVIGGLYASKNEDGTFGVVKVLAVDESAVHVRIYRNKFKSVPQDLDTSVLTLGRLGDSEGFGVGHAPIEKRGWIDSQIFLKQEPVREEELKGYKYYLDQMQQK